ncbi:MAG: M48 family metalloprotease [Pseudomonadota bacterium]
MATVLARALSLLLFAGLAACAAQTTRPDAVPDTLVERDPDDAKLGAEAHPQILERYGGAYDDPALAAYVTGIGERIVAVSEQPDADWTFTVLDTPTINAFAVPGGYIYVTRGLVALAKDEAELAGVIGHEIGHVTAGHGGLRRDRSTAASVAVLLGSLGLAVLGVDPTLTRGAMQAGQVAAGGTLASYSRSDELAADNLGVRYLARAGYDPYAQADFLERLGASTALEADIAGASYNPNRVEFFASHPASADRTRLAIQVADSTGTLPARARPTAGNRGRERYLDAIDGVIWGDSPEQGFVEGRRFSHPVLRFRYEVPEGFRIRNTSGAVLASGPEGSRIILDAGEDPGGSVSAYIAERWAPALGREVRSGQLRGPQVVSQGGLDAAEAVLPVELSGTIYNALLYGVRHNGRIYRVTGLVKQGSRLLADLRAAARSFDPLSAAEAAEIKAPRLRIVSVGPGDTVEALTARMAVDQRAQDRFRLINDLGSDDVLRPGQRVKLIAGG